MGLGLDRAASRRVGVGALEGGEDQSAELGADLQTADARRVQGDELQGGNEKK